MLKLESPVIVTIPALIGDTDKLSPKSIVPAVPTVEPLFLITTPPAPEPTIPVRPEPSPMNVVAVTTPVMLIPPVPVIVLWNKSKLPPSWGEVSSTTLLRLPPPPPPPAWETTLYETNSTISPTKQPTDKTTAVPFVAVNSASVNLIPLTNTSMKFTV